MPVTQPPRASGGIDHGDVQCVLGIDVADGQVLKKVWASHRVLRIGGSIRSREVVDGAAIIHGLAIGVVGENGKPCIELAANRYLQPVLVGAAGVVVQGKLLEMWIGPCVMRGT